MKIRTDFVTNSSSSSYVVEISFTYTNGDKSQVVLEADTGDGNGVVDLRCTAEDIIKVDSLVSLMELLSNAIEIIEPDQDDEEEFYKEVSDEVEQEMKRFVEAVFNRITNLSQIASIHLKRTWGATGEGSSCFGWNLEYMAEELPGLAKRVCESEGEEKEVAKKALAEYLANFNGSIDAEWGGCFPSGFMGSKVTGSIVWDKFVDDIEELAKKVLEEELPGEDWAEETTEINMQTHEISQKAEYILDGMR